MPIYEYRCKKCGHVFEVLQRISDPAPQCPVCGGEVEKLLSSGVGLVFKGSGFYITDYVKKSGGEKKRGSGKKEEKH